MRRITLWFLSLLVFALVQSASAQYPGGGGGYPGGPGYSPNRYVALPSPGNPSGGTITGDNLFVNPSTGEYGGRSGYSPSGAVSLSGDMHFKFKWQGTDRPCPSVVAKIKSYIFVEGMNAQAENGIGHNPQRYVKAGVDMGCIVEGTRIYPMDLPNGDTIDIKVSPTASASDGRITVWVSVSIIPVDVTIGGTYLNNGYGSVLVGQKQSGALINPGLDLRNPIWTVSAPSLWKGETFGPNVTDATGEVGKASHHYFTHNSTDYHQNTFPFYTLKPGLEDVSCFASVWDPVDGNRGYVAPWRVVNAVAPPYGFNASFGTTTVVGPLSAPTYIHSGNYPAGQQGIAINYSVVTPEPFKTAQGVGQYALCQTLVFDHAQTRHADLFGKRTKSNPDGVFNLDTSFPYNPYRDAVQGTSPGGDTPDSEMYTGINYSTSFTSHDYFRMFLIYLPPGTDSINVPLYVFPWKWDTYAEQSLWAPTANPMANGSPQTYPISLFEWDNYFSTSP